MGKKEMSALENLFQIITSSTSSTSSSSSSSGGGVRVTSHGRSNGGKRGSSSPSPTEDPELQALSPQERLVKKVQETLVSKGSSSGDRGRGDLRRKNPSPSGTRWPCSNGPDIFLQSSHNINLLKWILLQNNSTLWWKKIHYERLVN